MGSTTDGALADVVESVYFDLQDLGMTRRRSGVSRGSSWVEYGGRLDDGAWAELRLRRTQAYAQVTVTGSLLLYLPVALGSKTISAGKALYDCRDAEAEALLALAEDVRSWLARLRGA